MDSRLLKFILPVLAITLAGEVAAAKVPRCEKLFPAGGTTQEAQTEGVPDATGASVPGAPDAADDGREERQVRKTLTAEEKKQADEFVNWDYPRRYQFLEGLRKELKTIFIESDDIVNLEIDEIEAQTVAFKGQTRPRGPTSNVFLGGAPSTGKSAIRGEIMKRIGAKDRLSVVSVQNGDIEMPVDELYRLADQRFKGKPNMPSCLVLDELQNAAKRSELLESREVVTPVLNKETNTFAYEKTYVNEVKLRDRSVRPFWNVTADKSLTKDCLFDPAVWLNKMRGLDATFGDIDGEIRDTKAGKKAAQKLTKADPGYDTAEATVKAADEAIRKLSNRRNENLQEMATFVADVRKDQPDFFSSFKVTDDPALTFLNAPVQENEALVGQFLGNGGEKKYLDYVSDAEIMNVWSKHRDELFQYLEYHVTTLPLRPTLTFNSFSFEGTYNLNNVHEEMLRKYKVITPKICNEEYKKLADPTDPIARQKLLEPIADIFPIDTAGGASRINDVRVVTSLTGPGVKRLIKANLTEFVRRFSAANQICFSGSAEDVKPIVLTFDSSVNTMLEDRVFNTLEGPRGYLAKFNKLLETYVLALQMENAAVDDPNERPSKIKIIYNPKEDRLEAKPDNKDARFALTRKIPNFLAKPQLKVTQVEAKQRAVFLASIATTMVILGRTVPTNLDAMTAAVDLDDLILPDSSSNDHNIALRKMAVLASGQIGVDRILQGSMLVDWQEYVNEQSLNIMRAMIFDLNQRYKSGYLRTAAKNLIYGKNIAPSFGKISEGYRGEDNQLREDLKVLASMEGTIDFIIRKNRKFINAVATRLVQLDNNGGFKAKPLSGKDLQLIVKQVSDSYLAPKLVYIDAAKASGLPFGKYYVGRNPIANKPGDFNVPTTFRDPWAEYNWAQRVWHRLFADPYAL